MVALAFALGALFLGIPHIQESAEVALAPKKQPPQDGPAGQDPGWLESPPHPPSAPPGPLDTREKGCDMQGVYCKNETKADEEDSGNGGEELKADDEGHSGDGGLKKLKKKLKAETKIAEAHERIDNAKDAKKKLKKKQKAEEKMDAAEKRKDAAERRKEGKQEEDGQQEESVWTDDGVDCPAPTASDGDKAKKVWTKLTAKQDGDVCDPEVRKHAFEGMDKDGSGTVDKSEVEAMLEADGAPKEAADMVMGMLDTNGDGTITKEEFNDALVCMMCS